MYRKAGAGVSRAFHGQIIEGLGSMAPQKRKRAAATSQTRSVTVAHGSRTGRPRNRRSGQRRGISSRIRDSLRRHLAATADNQQWHLQYIPWRRGGFKPKTKSPPPSHKTSGHDELHWESLYKLPQRWEEALKR
ncbi:UNVERIFIED_CONTAM: hypothetical protein K2H54_069283 [Gekko kuhli]